MQEECPLLLSLTHEQQTYLGSLVLHDDAQGAVQGTGTLLRGRLMRVSDVPTPSTEERCATSIRESHEGPVLMAINAERRKQGIEPLSKLTVCL